MAGGGSSSGGVTRIEPPSYQLPYLQGGLSAAQNLYNQNIQPVGFSPQTEAALQMQETRARDGSPVNAAAQNYATQTLSGGFLGANPYLDQMFNRAALGTQNQLASEFARSGRNVDAAEGMRSQQLNDLATNIYGGAYDAERNRMQGVLPYAPTLANQDYLDIQQLGNVGSQVENLASQIQNAPNASLDQYLSRVRGGDYGSSQRQTQSGSRLGGALGGGMLGSYYGPWGALGGAVLGGLLS